MDGHYFGLKKTSTYLVKSTGIFILNSIMTTQVSLNVCVQYDAEVAFSARKRKLLKEHLKFYYSEWFKHLVGYNYFTFKYLSVNVSDWAARNRPTFEWKDDSQTGNIYIDNLVQLGGANNVKLVS